MSRAPIEALDRRAGERLPCLARLRVGKGLLCSTLLSATFLAPAAHALMAGALPDTPARRVDPNTAASPWSSAVAVVVNGSTYSGVVVAPRFVLTAAHVVGGAAPEGVSVQVNVSARPVILRAVAITAFPGSRFPHDDLALIELASAVPAEVRIPPIWRGPQLRGLILTLVGYGASGNANVGATIAPAPGVKRAGRNVLDAVSEDLPGQPGRTSQPNQTDKTNKTSQPNEPGRPSPSDPPGRSLFYLFDFDGPSGNGPLGGPTLGNAVEAGLAGGDSGSPAYAVVGGRVWLVGINSFVWGHSNAGAYGFGTGGGGVLLGDVRFIEWLVATTGGTLAKP
jgi:hypothetical protein